MTVICMLLFHVLHVYSVGLAPKCRAFLLSSLIYLCLSVSTYVGAVDKLSLLLKSMRSNLHDNKTNLAAISHHSGMLEFYFGITDLTEKNFMDTYWEWLCTCKQWTPGRFLFSHVAWEEG